MKIVVWFEKNLHRLCYAYILFVAAEIESWQIRTCIMALVISLWCKKNDD